MNTGFTTRYRQNWAPESGRYASAEILLRHLQDGWEADPTVVSDWFEEQWGSYSKVYFFLLRREGRIMQMSVLASPILPRVLRDYHLQEIEPVPHTNALDGKDRESNSAARLM